VNPWTLLINALGSALAFFYDVIPEYGISIILLTVSVSLLLFPLTLKQTKSMKGMQEIQPEVKKLQKEYKEDREELNKRLMELYKEKGVNPAAGCLPMLVQMPIWFALYRVLWQGQGIPADSALSEVIDSANAALYTVGDNGELTGTLQAGVDITSSQFEHVTFLGMNLLVKPSQAVDLSNIMGSLPYIILILIIVAAGTGITISSDTGFATSSKRPIRRRFPSCTPGQAVGTRRTIRSSLPSTMRSRLTKRTAPQVSSIGT